MIKLTPRIFKNIQEMSPLERNFSSLPEEKSRKVQSYINQLKDSLSPSLIHFLGSIRIVATAIVIVVA